MNSQLGKCQHSQFGAFSSVLFLSFLVSPLQLLFSKPIPFSLSSSSIPCLPLRHTDKQSDFCLLLSYRGKGGLEIQKGWKEREGRRWMGVLFPMGLTASRGPRSITEMKGLETHLPGTSLFASSLPMFAVLWEKMHGLNSDAYPLILATMSSLSHVHTHTHIHMFHTYLWTYMCIYTLYHTPHKAWRNNENLSFLRELTNNHSL